VQNIKLELKEENMPNINITKHPTKRRVQDIKLELKEENLLTINKTKHPTKGKKEYKTKGPVLGSSHWLTQFSARFSH
jgi:hypothetical protein